MSAHTDDVDAALIGKLLADATLMALVPDGVFYDIAPAGKTRFIIVKLMTHAVDDQFAGHAFEQPSYLVKAVENATGTATTKAAYQRIKVLLDGTNGEGSTLTVPGYGTARTDYLEYVRYAEPDPDNAESRWQHRGAIFRVWVAAT